MEESEVIKGKRRGMDRLTPVPKVKAFVDRMYGRTNTTTMKKQMTYVVRRDEV
jgi:hypothetical protein